MTEDKVIEYGIAWLEALSHFRNIDFTQDSKKDLAGALLQMTHARFEREYRVYWEDRIKMEEATRQIAEDVAELLGTMQ